MIEAFREEIVKNLTKEQKNVSKTFCLLFSSFSPSFRLDLLRFIKYYDIYDFFLPQKKIQETKNVLEDQESFLKKFKERN